ncbi:MAG: hypothetical protein JW939_05795 [Candidatus Thermoplasmatota archaeon]|nr:hypothetical protein [Candidatus Thermoplasmatota archaeon]
MKETVHFINCTQWRVVGDAALHDALKGGKRGGTALDVFESYLPEETPLAVFDNVSFQPYIGANTTDAQLKAGAQVSEQVIMALRGEEPEHLVNRSK